MSSSFRNLKATLTAPISFLHRVHPQGISIFLVDLFCLLHSIGNPETVLVLSLIISFANRGDDTIPFLQRERHPPHKGGLVVNALSNSLLSDFHRIRLFQISESFPVCLTILPLNTEFPTDRRLSHVVLSAVSNYKHVSDLYSMSIRLVID
jgi:hypothetical protein